MGRRNKIPPELKIKAVHEYLNHEGSYKTIAKKYGVTVKPFRKWLAKYEAFGEQGFFENHINRGYPTELKIKVVHAYLDGEGSFFEIAKKYKIADENQVRQWVLKYNSHEKLKASGTGGRLVMTKGRKTTYNERIEIVKYCIENQNNYAKTSQKYQVSYQQVYSWTAKYEKGGVEALLDKRGKRKSESQMSELEKLKAQNKLLAAENKRKQMEIDLLKKLEEIERRRY